MNTKEREALISVLDGFSGWMVFYGQEALSDDEFEYGDLFDGLFNVLETFLGQDKDVKPLIKLLKDGKAAATEHDFKGFPVYKEKVEEVFSELYKTVEKLESELNKI